MRVETILPGTSSALAQFLLQMHNNQILELENKGQCDGAQHLQ